MVDLALVEHRFKVAVDRHDHIHVVALPLQVIQQDVGCFRKVLFAHADIEGDIEFFVLILIEPAVETKDVDACQQEDQNQQETKEGR